MDTQVFTLDPNAPDPAIIARAAAVLRDGGLVAFPTETVYGLGANAMDAAALRRIYAAKQRPASDPIIAHIWQLGQLDLLASEVPDIARELAEKFWPGALTLVLPRAEGVPEAIAQGMQTVAVRMPKHPIAQALLKAADTPIGAPSANTFTRPSATSAAHVLEDLGGRIDMILDGGPTRIGLESTVLDLSGDIPTVLRPGGVLFDDLQRVIPTLQLAPRYLEEDTDSTAPGQLLKHYSPRAQVMLFTGASSRRRHDAMAAQASALIEAGKQVAVLVFDEDQAAFPAQTMHVPLGSAGDLAAVGRRLFAAMRELDLAGADVILVADFGREGLGGALWDRLLRAAEGRVIHVA